jgi:hypothetical protein
VPPAQRRQRLRRLDPAGLGTGQALNDGRQSPKIVLRLVDRAPQLAGEPTRPGQHLCGGGAGLVDQAGVGVVEEAQYFGDVLLAERVVGGGADPQLGGLER